LKTNNYDFTTWQKISAKFTSKVNFTKLEKKSEKTPALKPAEISDLPPSISLRLFKEELEKSKYHSKKGKKNLLTKRTSIPISRFLL